MTRLSGVWLRPVERTVRVREAPGSNPGTPTKATAVHKDGDFRYPYALRFTDKGNLLEPQCAQFGFRSE